MIAVAPAGAPAAGPAGAPPAIVSAAAPSAAASAPGLLRRADLGSGWTLSLAPPVHPPALACGAPRTATGAATASSTWTIRGQAVFASGSSYAFATAVAQRRAWAATAGASARRCLEGLLAGGSSHGVRLRATGVSALHPWRLTSAGARLAVRRYLVSGTATGAGQEAPVSLEVVFIGTGNWIARDEFSAVASSPPAGVDARAAGRQARRGAQGSISSRT